MPNQNLSICIPTYKRPEVLAEGLSYLIPFAKELDIAIFVQDDGSHDHTPDVVSKLQAEYEHLHFRSLPERLGYDRSFHQLLTWPTTRYRWLLGDYSRIRGEWLGKMHELLTASLPLDLVVVNGAYRIRGLASQDYESANKLLHDLGWHMSWLSCSIYSDRLVEKADFETYYGTNFAHFCAIFDYLSRRPVRVRWEGESIVFNTKLPRKHFYEAKTIQMFINRWTEAVISLPPAYSLKEKIHALRAHSPATRMNRYRTFIEHRANGSYDRAVFNENRWHLWLATPLSTRRLSWIARSPRLLMRTLSKLMGWFSN
ncbi:MAG: glycosyltransferase family 2 protein [Bdellovibrionota bacterium]